MAGVREGGLEELVQPRSFPGCEISTFAIITVLCQVKLGANQEDLLPQHDDLAVVPDPIVEHWHTNIHHEGIRVTGLSQIHDHFP